MKLFLICFSIFSIILSLLSCSEKIIDPIISNIAWQQVNGPFGGEILTIVINEKGYIYAGTSSGLYRSMNNGETWRKMDFPNIRIIAIFPYKNNKIYVGTDRQGIYTSDDDGNSWKQVGLDNTSIFDIVIDNRDYIYCATYPHFSYGNFMYISKDFGKTWDEIKYFNTRYTILTLSTNSKGYIYAIGGSGLHRSTNSGETWTTLDSNIRGTSIVKITANDNIYSSNSSGYIFYSSDDGNSWKILNNSDSKPIRAMTINAKGNLFIGNFDGVYRLLQNTGRFENISNGLTNPYIISLANDKDGTLFAGTYYSGIFRSTNDGKSWSKSNQGITNLSISTIFESRNGYIFVGVWNDGLFRSNNFGETWESIKDFLNQSISCIITNKVGDILVGIGDPRGTDYTTEPFKLNFNEHAGLGNNILKKDDKSISSDGWRIYYSSDNGKNWVQTNEKSGIESYNLIYCFGMGPNGDILAGTSEGIYKSTDNGKNWEKLENSLKWTSITQIIYNDNDIFVKSCPQGRIYKSADGGKSFERLLKDKDYYFSDIRINNYGEIFLISRYGDILKSNDNGKSWISINYNLSNLILKCLETDDNDRLYIGSYNNEIYFLNNQDKVWKKINDGLPEKFNPSLFFMDSRGFLWMGTDGNGIYRIKNSVYNRIR